MIYEEKRKLKIAYIQDNEWLNRYWVSELQQKKNIIITLKKVHTNTRKIITKEKNVDTEVRL